MTPENIKASFLDLPPTRQTQLLAQLALEWTVYARGAYPGQVDEREAARKLPVFNEVEHTITGQLAHLVVGDLARYPDDVLIDILFEKAQQGGCAGELARAFEWSFSRN
jgi:hypothetical protein